MRVFSEIQRFTQWWVHLITLVLFGMLFYLVYNWFVLQEGVSNVAVNDSTGQIVVILAMLLTVVLVYAIRLKTTIDEIGIHYQFLPINLSKKTIRWGELKKCYVRTYSPLTEYGGWGYRGGFFGKGKALNVKGDQGIQLEFQNGKKLLIGTQKEKDAHEVIERNFK